MVVVTTMQRRPAIERGDRCEKSRLVVGHEVSAFFLLKERECSRRSIFEGYHCMMKHG